MEKEKLDIVFNIRFTDNTKSVIGKNQCNAISHNENGIVSFRYDLDVYKPEIAPNGRVELYYPESDFIEGETVYADVYYDEDNKKYYALIEFKPRLKNIDLISNAFDSYFCCAEMKYVPGYKDQCKAASWESPEICVKPKELLAIKNKKPKGNDSKNKIAALEQQIQNLQSKAEKLEIENTNLKKAANSKDPKDMVNFLNQKIKDLEYKNQTLETENKNLKKAAHSKDSKDTVSVLTQKIEDLENKNQKLEAENKELKKDLEAEKNKSQKPLVNFLNQKIKDLEYKNQTLETENKNLKKAAHSKDSKDTVSVLTQKIEDLENKNQKLEAENKELKKDLEAEKNKSQKPLKDKNLEIKFANTEIVKGKRTSYGYEPDENGKLIVRVNIKGDPHNPKSKLTGKIRIVSDDDSDVCGINSVGEVKYDEANSLYYAEVVCDPKLKATWHSINSSCYGRYPTIEYIPDDQSSYETALFEHMMTIRFPVDKLLELENKKAENKNLDDPDKKIKDLENKNQKLEAENKELKKDLEAEKNKPKQEEQKNDVKPNSLEIKDIQLKVIKGNVDKKGVTPDQNGEVELRAYVDVDDKNIKPDGEVCVYNKYGFDDFEKIHFAGKIKWDEENKKYYANIVIKPKLKPLSHKISSVASNLAVRYIPKDKDPYRAANFMDRIRLDLDINKFLELENKEKGMSREVFDNEYINSYMKKNNLEDKLKNIDLTSEAGKKEIKNMVNDFIDKNIKADKKDMSGVKEKVNYVFDALITGSGIAGAVALGPVSVFAMICSLALALAGSVKAICDIKSGIENKKSGGVLGKIPKPKEQKEKNHDDKEFF